MPTLAVANIQTGSTTTDLTLRTGNTSGPSVILYSNNSGIAITSNSINVLLSINATSNVFLGGVAVGTSGAATVANVSGTGQLITSGNVTPSIITSNTTAWNPDSTDIATIIRVQANAAGAASNTAIYEAYISGFSAGTNGQIYTISNIGAQKIQLRNEDSANETTAANRFNLPNHIWLYGYQSIQMIYDGTLARWKPLTLIGASPSLSLGYDYENTVTVRMDYKSLLTKGFWAGGQGPSPNPVLSTIDKITYSTDTRQTTFANTISQARWILAAAGNVDKGFFTGGLTPTIVATADKITYATEANSAVAGANLSTTRFSHSGVGNADKGFFAAGASPAIATTLATADRTTYSSETTAAVSGFSLSQARASTASVGNSDKGFFSGGQTTSPTSVAQTTSDRTTYSTETTAAVSGANLSQARAYAAAAGNSDKGFFSGGWSGTSPTATNQTTTGKTIYSTETHAAVSGANLSQARNGLAAAGNSDKGYFSGGSTTVLTTTGVVTTDVTTYSSETTAAVSGANLSQSRGVLAGV